MTSRKVPIQSLIDHIKTAIDVDPWAKEMVEELLKEQPEIVRCKDCKHYKLYRGRVSGNLLHECEIFDLDIDEPDWFCANGERRCEND